MGGRQERGETGRSRVKQGVAGTGAGLTGEGRCDNGVPLYIFFHVPGRKYRKSCVHIFLKGPDQHYHYQLLLAYFGIKGFPNIIFLTVVYVHYRDSGPELFPPLLFTYLYIYFSERDQGVVGC